MIFVSWILYRMLTLDENMKESMRSYYKASDEKAVFGGAVPSTEG